jgi:hypothetical protein
MPSSFVDSSKKKLSKDEIVAIAAKETGGKYTPEQIKASLMAEVAEMDGLAMQEGNTIFIIHKLPNNPTIGMFRAINGDTLPNYFKNSLAFTKAMGLMGFEHIVTEFEDRTLLSIFKYVRRNQPFRNMGYSVQTSKDGKHYQVIVNLGDTKQPRLQTRGFS